MLGSAKFIAIDNEQSHLAAITGGLQLIGIPCLGIRYDGNALNPEHFAGVRVLLLDLHLISGAAATTEAAHFALIAALLEDNIGAQGGPFIIVLWTQHPQRAADLIAYLEANIQLPHARPLAVIPMDKTQYIQLATGTVDNPANLTTALTEHLVHNPQIKAILTWEAEVNVAAANTLSSIMRLIPPDKISANDISQALDDILSTLAEASAGKHRANSDLRGAINGVLAPILSDRLHAMTGDNEVWTQAITKVGQKQQSLSNENAGSINTMLHVEVAACPPDTWGAVVRYPDGWARTVKTRNLFGLSYREILSQEFKIAEADMGDCVPVLIRVGAACDYAQNKPGPIPFLFGIERSVPLKKTQFPQSVWVSPRFRIDDRIFEVLTSGRFLVALAKNAVTDLEVRYRFREQILMEIIGKVSTYISRPGKISV